MGLTPFFPLLLFILSKYHTTITLSINTLLSKTLIIEIICDSLTLAYTYEIAKSPRTIPPIGWQSPKHHLYRNLQISKEIEQKICSASREEMDTLTPEHEREV